MSRYGYDYSLTSSRPPGRGSAFAAVLAIGAVVAVSAVSGAVVTLQLFGPAESSPTNRSAIAVAAPAPVAPPHVVPPYIAAEHLAMPRVHDLSITLTAPHASVGTIVEQTKAVAAVAQSTPAQASTPVSPPAPQAAAAPAPTASADEQSVARASDSELTFTSGYARRRAVQQAAASATKVDTARLESQSQFGRVAVKARPRIARTNVTPDPRRTADARQPGGPFDRSDSDRFDFGRRQAMAYGDPRGNRRSPQQGGPFSSGGFFGGLF
jgi:hypothetical protein